MIKHIMSILFTMLVVWFLLLSAANSQLPMQPITPQVPVYGVVIDSRTQTPVPGLTVSLIHPILGRSAPAFTDQFGRFTFVAIPIRSEPYYIEIYWGHNIVYRSMILINGPISLRPIFL